MGLFERFPYSNFHNLNLDWVIEKIKDVNKSVDDANLAASEAAENAAQALNSAASAAQSAEAAQHLAGLGSPYAVSDPTEITDVNKIYLYTGASTSAYLTGHWYYYNGTEWVDGGVYSESEYAAYESEILPNDYFITGYYSNDDYHNSSTRLCNREITVMNKYDILEINASSIQVAVWARYAPEMVYTELLPYSNQAKFTFQFERPATLIIQMKRVSGNAITPSAIDAVITIRRSLISKNLNKRVYNVIGINHRGYQTVAPENTLPAFRLSKIKGFNWIECDIQFTSDGIPVILHDRSINRTARMDSGSTISDTINIDSITYQDALNYDFGIYKGAQYAGTRIPTLEETLLLCRNIGLKVRIELKSETVTAERIPTIINLVRKYGMLRNIEFVSFSYDLLQTVVASNPDLPVCLVVNTLNSDAVSNARMIQSMQDTSDLIRIGAPIASGAAAIELAKDAGIPLDAWTITKQNQILEADPYYSSFTTNSPNPETILYDYNI